jgi:hypothetical protein
LLKPSGDSLTERVERIKESVVQYPAKTTQEGISMPVKPGWEGRFFEDFEVGDIYR